MDEPCPHPIYRTGEVPSGSLAAQQLAPCEGEASSPATVSSCLEANDVLISSRPPRLGPRRRRSCVGILGPEVPRIAPLHLGPYRRPRSLPEARKIARDLDWPLRRRKQMERERQLAIADRWMLREPKQLLHPDAQGWCTHRRIVNGVTVAGWRLEVRRSLLLQTLP